ncbi:hypothetical protein [Dolichospermum sp. UHCC 0259]|uniref:hypothetical protein n=1 Tax=Dolichospermum sp. UHCC 0259 TaxID=2590010 RepID=UPI001444DC37|nr:hypothetical protein [Dolichospermum sp. UHCC 0259]MTJ48027.1 hypothetical protein [Dolichospermum sp. UHCC 0259]
MIIFFKSFSRSQESGVRSQESGVRSQDGRRRKESGVRSQEGGRRKEEGGRRKEEGGRIFSTLENCLFPLAFCLSFIASQMNIVCFLVRFPVLG